MSEDDLSYARERRDDPEDENVTSEIVHTNALSGFQKKTDLVC